MLDKQLTSIHLLLLKITVFMRFAKILTTNTVFLITILTLLSIYNFQLYFCGRWAFKPKCKVCQWFNYFIIQLVYLQMICRLEMLQYFVHNWSFIMFIFFSWKVMYCFSEAGRYLDNDMPDVLMTVLLWQNVSLHKYDFFSLCVCFTFSPPSQDSAFTKNWSWYHIIISICL
jgi:hypothetical protein